MSLVTIEDDSPQLREHRAKATPKHFQALLDQLTKRMIRRFVMPDIPGLPVGRFEAVMGLGSGGYGTVVEAWDPHLERAVALKLCVNDKPEATELLLAEARTLAALSHPNIITIHDTGRYEGSLFLVMELATGGSLTRRALREERMPWYRLVPIFADVARGLAAAHEAGVIHGDVKPSNVLLRADGRPCVADFGLARIVGAPPLLPNAIGTLPYAAPEVLRGAECDPLSDQWSLFVTLWECLDRRLPFMSYKELRAKLLTLSEADVLRSIMRWAAGPARLNAEVPEALHEVLARGLALDPSARFPNMRAVADALDEVIARDWAEVEAVDADDVLVLEPDESPLDVARRGTKGLGVVAFVIAVGAGLAGQAHLLAQREAPHAEQSPPEQKPPDQSIAGTDTPCATDGIPVEPDANTLTMCRMVRAGDLEHLDSLWGELAKSRELQAQQSGDPNKWLELSCAAATLAQTFQDEARKAEPTRAKVLRKGAIQFAEQGQLFLDEISEANETAAAASLVGSVIAGISSTDKKTKAN